MQRNLDEVLRAVPMDLTDSMEQISGSKPRTSLDMDQLKSPTLPAVHETGQDTVCEGRKWMLTAVFWHNLL